MVSRKDLDKKFVLISVYNKNKLGYAYLLSPKGISEKTRITISYMKLKMKEYDELKKELKGR